MKAYNNIFKESKETTDAPESTNDFKTFKVKVKALNVRCEPMKASKSLMVIAADTKLKLGDKIMDSQRQVWAEVTMINNNSKWNREGTKGYVMIKYLEQE